MAKRLLLIDDEPNLLVAVASCLRSEGFEVNTARSARDALALLAEAIPDMIISDIRMPGMDGYTLVHRIRSSPRSSLVPIVFLTAKDQKADRVEGFRVGVDAYITKPFEPDELLAVIASIFSRVERTRAEVARLIGTARVDPEPLLTSELTETEARIAEAVAKGLPNRAIAAEFGLSVRTVENHISHILSKKGFTNRVEIARYILGGHSPGQ